MLAQIGMRTAPFFRRTIVKWDGEAGELGRFLELTPEAGEYIKLARLGVSRVRFLTLDLESPATLLLLFASTSCMRAY